MRLKAIIVITLISTLAGYAESVKRYALPMTIDFSGQYNTAITLEFVSLLKNPISFKELFSRNSNDEYLNVFEAFIEAIDKNSMSMIKPFIGKHEIKSMNTPEAILKHFHRNYIIMKQKFSDIFLMERIKGKDQEVFIWGVTKDDGSRVVAGPLFMKQGSKIIWFWMVNPIQSAAIICGMMIENKQLSSVEDGQYEYSLMLKDATDSQMFKLKFNGRKYDYINLDKTAYSDDRIISFYLDSIKALESSKEKYADFFTEKSGAKFLEQVEKYPFMLDVIKKRNKKKIISFVIEAKPFYLVFYRREHDTIKIFNNFDYLVETGKGLKFTNYAYHDSIDELLRYNIEEIKKIVFPPVAEASSKSK